MPVFTNFSAASGFSRSKRHGNDLGLVGRQFLQTQRLHRRQLAVDFNLRQLANGKFKSLILSETSNMRSMIGGRSKKLIESGGESGTTRIEKHRTETGLFIPDGSRR